MLRQPPQKAPNRSTVAVGLTLKPETAEKVKEDAQTYGMTLSDYVSALVNGQAPIAPPGTDQQNVSLAGIRVLEAIKLLEAMDGDHTEAIATLRDSHRYILAEIKKYLPTYKASVEAYRVRTKGQPWGELEALPT